MFCLYVAVQVASSEQLLGVAILHFENVYNAEIRFGEYCCCDTDDPPCTKTLETLAECPNACSPFFSVHFQYCPTDVCIDVKPVKVFADLTSEKSAFLIEIPFNQTEWEIYSQVRICNCM